MSVVGFDIGTQKCTIGVAKGGGIEIVLNEESDRFTPSYVAFGERLRFVGSQAKQHMSTNPQSCVFDVKRMIGRSLSDPVVQREKQLLGCEIVSGSNGEAAAKVNYLNETHEYTMTQLMAMMLVKLKTSVESGLGIKSMKDCVLSVPCFFTDIERQCVLNASSIAGLNCLKLLNETTAIALCYGIFRTDFPAEPAAAPEAAATTPTNQSSVSAPFVGKSKMVAFVDIGHAASQLCLVAFNAGKLRVLASVYDPDLGGRDFDSRLYKHFAEEIKSKYKLDVSTKRRAQLRLLVECERMKKLMSANSSNIPMNIDSLMEDRDVTSQMKRADFEALCTDLFERVEKLAQSLLKQAGIQPTEIDDVEIVGGSTRIPAIRERIKAVFGREPSTTLNADEAVARGCAIQCAILSPNFRVREFAVSDCLQFPVTIQWDKTSENEENEIVIFNKADKLPASKMLTLNKTAPFTVSARYTYPDEVPHPVKHLGKYFIHDIPANSSKVKVKVRISKHGFFQLAEATGYEKVVEIVQEQPAQPVAQQPEGTPATAAPTESQKEQPMEQSGSTEQKNGTVNGGSKDVDMAENGDAANLDGVEAANETPTVAQPTQKVKTRARDLPFDMDVPGVLTEAALRELIERENSIQSQNKMEKDRVDSKNAVEEYVLNMNRELSESLQPYASPAESKSLLELCESINSWLYDEGEDQPRSVYNEKLSQLTKIGDPIRRRQYEHQHRPSAFDHLGRALMHYRKIVDSYKSKDDKYAHIDAADMERVEKTVSEKQAWFNEKHSQQMARKLFEDPIVFADQIVKEAEFMEKICNPIVNRPKPAPKPPTPPPAETTTEAKTANGTPAKTDNPPPAATPAGAATATADTNGMELD